MVGTAFYPPLAFFLSQKREKIAALSGLELLTIRK